MLNALLSIRKCVIYCCQLENTEDMFIILLFPIRRQGEVCNKIDSQKTWKKMLLPIRKYVENLCNIYCC